MLRRARFLVAVTLASALLVGACGGTSVSPPSAAEVNGREIALDALDDELQAIRSNDRYMEFLDSQGNTVRGDGDGTFSAEFVRRVLTRQIYLELVHQELTRRKLDVTDADLRAVQADVANEVGGPDILEGFDESYRRTLARRSAEVAAVQLALSDVDVDEAALRRYYDENAEQFSETCVSHILFAVVSDAGEVDTAATAERAPELLAQAQAAKARVAAGEDFAALARELTKDASNREEGGNLQCGGPGRFVPEFETVLDATPTGQVSDPVQTQFGYHLIKVDSRAPRSFDEVRDEIRQQLLGTASQSFGLFLREAITGADIEINPRFGRFEKNTQNPTILAPSAPTTVDVGGPASDGAGLGPLDLGDGG